MEARQFYNRYISPLVTKSFACKWSEDNRLAVLTEKGVHIFEIIPSPTQANPILNVSRSFIYSPETLPADVFLNDILSGIFDWKRDDVYSFLLKEAFIPNFPKALKVTPEIVDVVWSPRNLVHPWKCLLALVNSAGSVELAMQIDRSWFSIHQFTSEWLEVINKDSLPLKDDETVDCQAIKQKLERLLATSITWSSIYYTTDSAAFAYLVIAYRNSEIVIWKIHKIENDVCINSKVNVELKFKKKLISENIKINTLLWVNLNEKNYFLIVGFFNGQIGTLKLQEFEDGITSCFFSMNYDDIDNIPVDFICISQQTDEWIEIVIVKGMYLLFLMLDLNGKTIDMKFISSPGFSISGISIFNPHKILITTQDGNICAVEKSNDHNKLICKPIKTDILKNNIQYLGLANSPNKLILTLITSPGSMYDHLVDREPSNVCFFDLFNAPSSNPVDILYSNKEQSLLDNWDCLEVIKINALKYNNLSTIIPKIAINLESLSLYKLRIAYWIMIISETLKKKISSTSNSDEVPKPCEEIEQAKSYIFLHSAINHLNKLALQKNLTDIQKLYMSLLRNHLEIWLAGEEEEAETDLSQKVKQVLEATSKFELIRQENCNLCGVLITEPWASCCSSGHKLPRCAITCLQVTCTKFRSCIVCSEVFHPCLDLEKDVIKCLYCDLPVYYRHQIIDSSLMMSEKNLSRKQIAAGNNKEPKEDADN